MAKRKVNLNYVNTTYDPEWEYCVSISSGGYMSLSWTEHFFRTKDEAEEFKSEAERQGYATMIVTPAEY